MEERAAGEVTLATLLASAPNRPLMTVVLDAVANVDALAQDAKARVVSGESDPDALTRLAEMSRLAHSLAASAVTTRVVDMMGQFQERWGDVVAGRVGTLLMQWLGLPMGGFVIEAVTATLGELDTENPGKAPHPNGPPLLELMDRAVAVALAPRLGLPVELVARWHRQAMEAVEAGHSLPDVPAVAVAALPAAPAPEPIVPPEQEPERPPVIDGEVVLGRKPIGGWEPDDTWANELSGWLEVSDAA